MNLIKAEQETLFCKGSKGIILESLLSKITESLELTTPFHKLFVGKEYKLM
jgi:hypothetical protein